MLVCCWSSACAVCIPLISFTVCSFVLAVVVTEFVRGTWVRHPMTGENLFRAFFSLIWHNKRRYGGYIVHIGVVLLLVGVTAFYSFKESGQQTLKKGETHEGGRVHAHLRQLQLLQHQREAGGPSCS